MKIALTTVVRAAKKGDVHGGFYVIDYPSKEIVYQSICKEDFGGDNERGGERGLRGVAVADDRIYVAGSSSVSILDAGTFETISIGLLAGSNTTTPRVVKYCPIFLLHPTPPSGTRSIAPHK